MRSKSTDSECLQNCESSLLRSNSWASVVVKRPFDHNIIVVAVHSHIHAGGFCACMNICLHEYVKGAPFYEQKQLQSSKEHRRCVKPSTEGFVNGAGEL